MGAQPIDLGKARDMARLVSDIKHVISRSMDSDAGNSTLEHNDYTIECYNFGRNRQLRVKVRGALDVAETQLVMTGVIKTIKQSVGLVGTLGKSAEQVEKELEFSMTEGLDEVRADWNLAEEVAH